MIPVEFKEQNIILTPPENWKPNECVKIPGFMQEDKEHDSNHFISCWKLTPPEIETLLETGVIWVHVSSKNHPPILLDLSYPF